jgi:hypothetical protein
MVDILDREVGFVFVTLGIAEILRAPVGLNRPWFPRGLFVQNSGGFFKGVQLCMEFILHFLRRPMADSAM